MGTGFTAKKRQDRRSHITWKHFGGRTSADEVAYNIRVVSISMGSIVQKTGIVIHIPILKHRIRQAA